MFLRNASPCDVVKGLDLSDLLVWGIVMLFITLGEHGVNNLSILYLNLVHA